MPQLDILYMTRVQRERFFNEADYIRLKDSYILDAAISSATAEAGPGYSPSSAPRQRDRRGCGQGPARLLFHAGHSAVSISVWH